MLWYQTSFGRVLVGPQVFQWGLGMLANDDRLRRFLATRGRETSTRLAFAARPLARSAGSWRNAVFVAADLVLRDDNAVWFDGDRAFAGARRAHADSLEFGALLAVRDQTDRADPYWPDRDALTRGSSRWMLMAASRSR